MKKTDRGEEKVIFCVHELKTLLVPTVTTLLTMDFQGNARWQHSIWCTRHGCQPNVWLRVTKLKPLTATLQQEPGTCLNAQENAVCGCTWVFSVTQKQSEKPNRIERHHIANTEQKLSRRTTWLTKYRPEKGLLLQHQRSSTVAWMYQLSSLVMVLIRNRTGYGKGWKIGMATASSCSKA